MSTLRARVAHALVCARPECCTRGALYLEAAAVLRAAGAVVDLANVREQAMAVAHCEVCGALTDVLCGTCGARTCSESCRAEAHERAWALLAAAHPHVRVPEPGPLDDRDGMPCPKATERRGVRGFRDKEEPDIEWGEQNHGSRTEED